MSEHIFNLRKNRPSIFGTGLIALDVILNDDDQHSQQVAAGGTCGNVLTILSYLEWDSYPLSRLNGDTASQRVLNDLAHWGVHLTFSSLEPSSRTPIIVQRIKKTSAGKPYHRFSLRCPECGNYLPHYQAVIADAVEPLIGKIKPSVFFMDRVSRGALMLAKASSQEGAIVVFEPSKIKDEKNVREALALAHILKYSHEKI